MKTIYKRLFAIAIPITIHGLITASINLTDVFLISMVGENQLAAAGLANQLTLILLICLFGINNSGVIFVAQYHGNKDTPSIKKIVALCSILSGLLMLLITGAALLLPQEIIGLYTADESVIEYACIYLRTVAFSYIFIAISVTLGQLLSGMSRTREAMYAGLVSLILNIVLTYLLIFGHCGFPQLGLYGAALATIIARGIESVILYTLIKIRRYPLFFGLTDIKKIHTDFIKKYFITGTPVMGSYLMWVLGSTTLMAIYARIGNEALVAVNIFSSIERIAYTGVIALSCATGIILGQELGRKEFSAAYKIARHLNIFSFILAVVFATLLALLADDIVELYGVTSQVQLLTIKILVLFCIIFPFATVNSVNMMGTLRAGGQTRQVFIYDLICMWGTSVPLAYIGYILELPIGSVFILSIGSGEVVKLVLSMSRVVSLKWAKSIT